MRKYVMLTWMLLCLVLAGCCGGENADLVVVNNSDRDACSIVLEYSGSTETVQAADGSTLLKPGQTYGLELEEGEVTAYQVAEPLTFIPFLYLARCFMQCDLNHLRIGDQDPPLGQNETWKDGKEKK